MKEVFLKSNNFKKNTNHVIMKLFTLITLLSISFLIIVFPILSFPKKIYADLSSTNNTKNINYTAVNDFLTRFYKTFLNNKPDSENLNKLTTILINNNATFADIIRNHILINDSILEKSSNEIFLTNLYKAFFNRKPDSEGYTKWLNLLKNGTKRYYILAEFINSAEFKSICYYYGINPGSLNLTKNKVYSSSKSLSNQSVTQDTINSKVKCSETENSLVSIINNFRFKNGKKQLIINSTLSNIAKYRSQDMLKRNYFSHTTPEGKNIFIILNENGYNWQAAGENIFRCNPISNGDANAIFNVWMSSTTHKNNMLSENFTQVGVSIIDFNSTRIATMVFSN